MRTVRSLLLPKFPSEIGAKLWNLYEKNRLWSLVNEVINSAWERGEHHVLLAFLVTFQVPPGSSKMGFDEGQEEVSLSRKLEVPLKVMRIIWQRARTPKIAKLVPLPGHEFHTDKLERALVGGNPI